MDRAKAVIEKMLAGADIRINGNRPWDIKVHDERLYDRVLAKGTLGFGEAYMDAWWDCERLDEMICRVLKARLRGAISKNFTNALHILRSKILNLQTESRSMKVADEHYGLDNDLYGAFLDPYRQYTCAYFKDVKDLDAAQEKKMHLICDKLKLKPSDRVLDMGCGWGGMAKWIASHYGCHVTGINISHEQVVFAREFTKGLPVEIIESDYRDVAGTYDKILAIGLMEHVGYKNHRILMEKVKKLLSPDGLFILHCCGRNDSATTVEPWIEKYIFPGGVMPSTVQISKASEGLFVMEDWHNFGQYYDKTLLAWWKNFDAAWPAFKKKYKERFYRMFRYYLLSCAGAFRARDIQLWQVVFSGRGVEGGYESVR
jgi:cyclopropane-fatty-acyl-phospholipid synthase